VAAEIERRIEVRFLSGPDTVLNFGDNAAANGTVGTDGLPDFDIAAGSLCCFRSTDHCRWK